MNSDDLKIISQLITDYQKSLKLRKVRRDLRKRGIIGRNGKLDNTSENQKVFRGLALLPWTLGIGPNACSGADDVCPTICIAHTGQNRAMTEGTLKADSSAYMKLSTLYKKWARNSFWFLKQREAFDEQLIDEILEFIEVAGSDFYFRFNINSDWSWIETIKKVNQACKEEKLPLGKYYDYTKNPYYVVQVSESELTNYRLTFSSSSKVFKSGRYAGLSRDEMIDEIMPYANVAVVWSKEELIPKKYNGYDVINGVHNDNRYNDPPNCIIGLALKTSVNHKASDFGSFVL